MTILEEIPIPADKSGINENQALVHATKADDESDESSSTEVYECRSFTLDMISCSVFFIGSSLYLWLAVIDVNYIDFYSTVDDNLLVDDYYYWNVAYNWTNNTDLEWEDDFLFYIDDTKTSVSRYQIIYFSAAFSFLVVGIVDLVHVTTGRPEILDPEASEMFDRCPKCFKRLFGCLGIYQWAAFSFIFGGIFGCSAALTMGNSYKLSNKLGAASVHLYLIEAFTIIGRRRFTPKQICSANNMLYFGDMFWLLGALIDVALSYCYLVPDLTYSMHLSAWAVVAALLWLIDSIFWIAGTLIIYKHFIHADHNMIQPPASLEFGTAIDLPVAAAVAVNA